MTDENPKDAPFPGADETDVEAERIIPPEQAPMDDAAGGTHADETPVSEEEAAATLGDFA